MEFIQNSNRCAILLHEIYGINQHILHYAQLLFEKGYDVYVPNLINQKEPFTYEEEEQAYTNFMENVGFLKAKSQVNQLITKIQVQYEHIRIVGFSIGATIGWLCIDIPSVNKVIGFYGTRIRDYTNINPTSNVILIYGHQEKSFNPAELKEVLSIHKHVDVKLVKGLHGFADPYSKNYNENLTNRFILSIIE